MEHSIIANHESSVRRAGGTRSDRTGRPWAVAAVFVLGLAALAPGGERAAGDLLAGGVPHAFADGPGAAVLGAQPVQARLVADTRAVVPGRRFRLGVLL